MAAPPSGAGRRGAEEPQAPVPVEQMRRAGARDKRARHAGREYYTIQLRNWRTGDAVPADDFAFQAPAGATEITIEELRERVSELPEHFAMGDTK